MRKFIEGSQPDRLLKLLQSRSFVPLSDITEMRPRIADHRSNIRFLRNVGHDIRHTVSWNKVPGQPRPVMFVTYEYHGWKQELVKERQSWYEIRWSKMLGAIKSIIK